MKNYYLHRINHESEVSRKLLAKGWLSIGFLKVATTAFVESSSAVDGSGYSNFDTALFDAYKYRFRSRNVLFRFIAEMKLGDVIVIPSWRSFGVYKVLGEVIPRDQWPDEIVEIVPDDCDLGFVHKVKPYCDKSENIGKQFADPILERKMKYRGLGLVLTPFANHVLEAIERFVDDNPISLSADLIDDLSRTMLESLNSYSKPNSFEQVVCDYFTRIGASSAEVQSKTAKHGTDEKQGDVDVVATFDHLKTVYYIQVKRHEGETGEWAIAQVKAFAAGQASLAKEGDEPGYATVLWALTLAENFSPEAKDAANAILNGAHAVTLVTGPEFARMMVEAGVASQG